MPNRYIARQFGANWGLYDSQQQQVIFYGEAWDVKAEATKKNKALVASQTAPDNLQKGNICVIL